HPLREILRAAFGYVVGAPIPTRLPAPERAHVLGRSAARPRVRGHGAQRGARADVDQVPVVAALAAALKVRSVAAERSGLAPGLEAFHHTTRARFRCLFAQAAQRFAVAGVDRLPPLLVVADLKLPRRIADALDVAGTARSASGGAADVFRLADLDAGPLTPIRAALDAFCSAARPLPGGGAHRAAADGRIAVVLGRAGFRERPLSVFAAQEIFAVAAMGSGRAGDVRADGRLGGRRYLELTEELLTAREREE